MPENPVDTQLAEFIEKLRLGQRDTVPQGGVRRLLRTAGAAMGTGVSVLSGRFRGKDQGLAAADLLAIEKLVSNLGELKGLAMKAGQIMSYVDDTLPPEMRALLGLLQTQSQPTNFERIQEMIREDLGDAAEDLIQGLNPVPLSVASIGQVHQGVLPDGTRVAVKVRHPGIREALESDFKMAGLGPLFTRLMVPSGVASVKEFIQEARDRMLEECDFHHEAARQEEFFQLFQDAPDLVIPRVWQQWSGSAVLTSTWEPGIGLEEFLASGPSLELCSRLGVSLFQFYFGTLYRTGLFHADPHPGNYAFRPDGRIVVYDFGCTRRFDRESVDSLVQLSAAVVRDQEEGVREAFSALGGRIPSDEKSYLHARRLLRGFFSPMLNPPGRIDAGVRMDMGQAFRDKKMLMKLQMPGKLLFLFRIRFGLYAVLARLGAEADWAGMERKMARDR